MLLNLRAFSIIGALNEKCFVLLSFFERFVGGEFHFFRRYTTHLYHFMLQSFC